VKPIAVLILIASALHAQSIGYSSSDVADATERITGRRAHMSAEMRLLSGARLHGPAITMRAVRDDRASAMDEGLKAIRLLESAAPGSVVVLVLEGDKSFAVFGATFATLAKSRKLGGFVIDGSMRGVTEFRHLSVPMFATGAVPGSAGGHYRLDAVNTQIVCAGVEVAPGDLIVGDVDGVAIAPKVHVSDVLDRAKRLRREKQALLPLVARYKSYTEAVKRQRAGYNARVKKSPK
jgi:4-hydroxy-4-methyl-2-oxoglutarate aldolase